MGTKYFIKGHGFQKDVDDLREKIDVLEASMNVPATKTNDDLREKIETMLETSMKAKPVKKRSRKRTAIQSPPEAVEAKKVELDLTEESGW